MLVRKKKQNRAKIHQTNIHMHEVNIFLQFSWSSLKYFPLSKRIPVSTRGNCHSVKKSCSVAQINFIARNFPDKTDLIKGPFYSLIAGPFFLFFFFFGRASRGNLSIKWVRFTYIFYIYDLSVLVESTSRF